MALFGFFNKKNENTNTIPFQFTPDIPDSSMEEVTNDAPVVEETTPENKPLTVSYATGWPIDIIYGYLHKNYEKRATTTQCLIAISHSVT